MKCVTGRHEFLRARAVLVISYTAKTWRRDTAHQCFFGCHAAVFFREFRRLFSKVARTARRPPEMICRTRPEKRCNCRTDTDERPDTRSLVSLITLHSATALTAGPGILLNLYVPKLAPQPRTPPLSRTPTAVINRWNLALDRVVEEVPAPVERAGAVTSIRSPLYPARDSVREPRRRRPAHALQPGCRH